MNKLLVKYNQQSGDVGCDSHVVIQVDDDEKIEDAIHNYFIDFYSNYDEDEKDSEKAGLYTYQGYSIAIRIGFTHLITEKELEVFRKFGLAT